MPVIKWLQNIFEGKKRDSSERQLYGEIDKQLTFAVSEPLSLGVEFELGLLDAKTLLPANKSLEIIDEISSPCIKKEGQQHMVEVTSAIATTVQESESQLKSEIEKLYPACEKRGLLITGTGRPPTVKSLDTLSTRDERLNRLSEERQILRERFGALGMHIHIGMKDAEECVRFNNFFMHFLPHLIALSASSPFEEGVFTGLASIRPAVAESMPIAGSPYYFEDWQGYIRLCRALYRAGSIKNLKDLWWDQRPSPSFGTLEIRVCDQPATLAEGMAIVAFVHLLAHWFKEHQSWLDEMPRPNVWRSRENKWRAMRYGMDAQLVTNNQGETTPLCDDMKNWLQRLQPISDQLGYQAYADMLGNIMTRGNSAKRQQRLWEASQRLETVSQFNCDEFAAQTPLWDKLESLLSDLAVIKDKEPPQKTA